MKEKNYNLELVRMISFILVIAIHVSNYFCRAYGKIPQGEYLFSLVIDTAARLSVPCFFMISELCCWGETSRLKSIYTGSCVLSLRWLYGAQFTISGISITWDRHLT